MGFYTGVVYPAVLVACGILALTGIATMIHVKVHRGLEAVVTAFWIVTAIQAIAVLIALLGDTDASLVMVISYLIATIIVLPLLGIGRLGEPDAAKTDPDPNRPVLEPDQIARVDGGAAVIVAIAAGVLAWRIFELLVA